MTLAEIIFQRRLRDLRQKYKHDLEQIELDFARRNGVALEDVKGSGRKIALEAHARFYIIDPLLKELGWDVNNPATMVIEDTVEAVAGGEQANRRFLDYHGRDNAESRSLVIIEAKRPNAALPVADGWDIPNYITKALTDIHTVNPTNPTGVTLSGEWQKWLATLIDYVRRSKDRFGHAPVRVTISNGEWFVVFDDVEATLLSENPSYSNIIVFKNLEDVEAQAARFYYLLNYGALSGHILPQHPSALPEFLSKGEEALCAKVVDICYLRHGARQPFISIRVAAMVRTTGGAWVFFHKNESEPFLPLSQNQEDLPRQFAEIENRSNNLLADLSADHQIKLLTPAEFEKIVEKTESRGGALFPEHRSRLINPVNIPGTDGETYRLMIGNNFMYFSLNHEYDECPFHNWNDCRRDGNAASANGIFAPCSDPRVFFPSGSRYHCAHVAVHNARKNDCVLLSFEEYLCCRCCTFFQCCWPQGGQDLPCQKH